MKVETQIKKEIYEKIQGIVKRISKPITTDGIIFNYTVDAIMLDNILRWLKNGEDTLVEEFLNKLEEQ